jgi:hypothetical protein
MSIDLQYMYSFPAWNPQNVPKPFLGSQEKTAPENFRVQFFGGFSWVFDGFCYHKLGHDPTALRSLGSPFQDQDQDHRFSSLKIGIFLDGIIQTRWGLDRTSGLLTIYAIVTNCYSLRSGMTHLKVSNQAIWDEQIDPPTLAHHESPATHPSQRSRTSEDRAKGMPASPPTCQYQCLAAHITEVHVKSYRIDLPYVMKSQRHMQSFASGHPSWGQCGTAERGDNKLCSGWNMSCFDVFMLYWVYTTMYLVRD